MKPSYELEHAGAYARYVQRKFDLPAIQFAMLESTMKLWQEKIGEDAKVRFMLTMEVPDSSIPAPTSPKTEE